MKQAKTEAATVVEKFKAEKEAEFARKAQSSSLAGEAATLERATDAEITGMKVTFEQNKNVRRKAGSGLRGPWGERESERERRRRRKRRRKKRRRRRRRARARARRRCGPSRLPLHRPRRPPRAKGVASCVEPQASLPHGSIPKRPARGIVFCAATWGCGRRHFFRARARGLVGPAGRARARIDWTGWLCASAV